jgi:asparagine synthase (glutamine-hydrolysing)
MCGINGYLRKHAGAAAASDIISHMNRRLKHRGPDSEGACLQHGEGLGFIDLLLPDTAAGVFPEHLKPVMAETANAGNCIGALGHRRLSIVDRSLNAHQPMADKSERYRLVFNGEIFNYRELRQELQSRGIRFFSSSDTEVLLHGWRLEGPSFLRRINGFFAGCMADAVEGTWTLFRDMPGVKPLFYLNTPDIFAFSSETPPLRALCPSVSVNTTQAAAFLTFGQTLINHSDTWYQELQSLEPGSTLEIRFSTWQLRKQQFNTQQQEQSPKSLEACLLQSIKLRMEAEVPVGFAASGGLDSSLILGMAAKLFPRQVPGMLAFSATSGDPLNDESSWQEQITAHTGVKRIAVPTASKHIHALPALVASADMPAAAWNNLAHYRLCEAARREGITVMLNGQGADELMAGYHAYLPAWFREAGWRDRKDFLQHLNHSGLSAVAWLKLRLKDGMKQRLGAERWQRKSLNHKAFAAYIDAELLENLPTPVLPDVQLAARLKKDYYGIKLGQMLQWEDRNSMAHSIESRNPFADDQDLAEAAWAVPALQKVHHGFTKYPLRALSQAYIPESLSWRKDKKGFTMPDSALTAESWPLMREWIADLPEAIIQKDALLALDDSELSSDSALAGMVFRSAALSLFLQQLK